MRMFRFLLLACLAVTISACSSTSVRHAPEYRSVISAYHDISILPPDSKVNEVDAAGGNKRMYDYEYNMEFVIVDQLMAELQNKGFRARFIDRKTLYDLGLSDAAAQLGHIYSTERDSLYLKPLWEKEKAFAINNSVSQAAALIGSKTNSQLLILTDYARFIKTNGARTQDVLMDVFLNTRRSDEADKAVMIVGIIEAKTGRILWSNMGMSIRHAFSSSADKKAEKEEMKRIVSYLLNPFNSDEK